jgi:hypothetical protein
MSSPTRLSSFDPAIHLHSAQDPPSDFQDDLEAVKLQQEETRAYNKQNRVVIQHRAWRQEDIFWSEPDCFASKDDINANDKSDMY